MVAKKCGPVQFEQQLDEMTLQSYLRMYKQPLYEQSMDAITKLIEVVMEKKKMKKDKRKKTGSKTEKTVKGVAKGKNNKLVA
jgi:hypothetical protein